MSERREDWPWFPLYAKDWLAAVSTISCEAEGAYIRLLAVQWEQGVLPGDLPSLARVVRLSPAAFRRVWREIAEHFPDVEGGRANRRLERVREEQRDARTRRREAGRRGASNRWHDGIADSIAARNAGAQSEGALPGRNAGHIPVVTTRAAASESTEALPARVGATPSSYAVACCVAANRALEIKFAGAYRTLVATVEAVTADAWMADGIPLELAVAVIAERIAGYRSTPRNRQPSTLRYFDAAVREAVEQAAVSPESDEPELDDWTGLGALPFEEREAELARRRAAKRETRPPRGPESAGDIVSRIGVVGGGA